MSIIPKMSGQEFSIPDTATPDQTVAAAREAAWNVADNLGSPPVTKSSIYWRRNVAERTWEGYALTEWMEHPPFEIKSICGCAYCSSFAQRWYDISLKDIA